MPNSGGRATGMDTPPDGGQAAQAWRYAAEHLEGARDRRAACGAVLLGIMAHVSYADSHRLLFVFDQVRTCPLPYAESLAQVIEETMRFWGETDTPDAPPQVHNGDTLGTVDNDRIDRGPSK
jgi:hypothetical protein